MKRKLDNNRMSINDMSFSGETHLPKRAMVKNVRMAYVTDAEGKRTEKVDSIRYECIDANTLSTFTLKVLDTVPVITAETLEEMDEPVYISIPVSEAVIKPYKIEYGWATVSIVVPYVELSID